MKAILKVFAACLLLIAGVQTADAQQPPLERTLTIEVEGAGLDAVLGKIMKETGVLFFYKNDEIDVTGPFTFSVEDATVEQVLNRMFAGKGVAFSQSGDQIVLKRQQEKSVVAQTGTNSRTTGTVVDRGGQPVIGATVMVKGTSNGTSTDLDGNFVINAPEGSTLEVMIIGYRTASAKAVPGGHLNIIMDEDVTLLEEVVVVGYGTTKKVNLTGAVDQVGADAFENRPVANASQMLMGAVPNLNISLSDGKPNRSASYNVRGTTSIGAGGSALVLIDGVEGDPAMLNPNDIESVTVLKDAASSAIYGSRAPYGVVLITTKDPSKSTSKFSINYTGNVAFQQPTAVPDVVTDGYIYSSLFYDAWYNYRASEPTGINNTQDFSLVWLDEFKRRKEAGNTLETTVNPDGKYVYYGNEDYYDTIYQDVITAQTHNISVSGKTDKISYFASGRIYDYSGLFNFNPDTYRTMNLRSKATAEILPWLTFSENIEYTHDDYRVPTSWLSEGRGVIWRSISDQGHPSSPIFNPDGTLTLSGARSIGGLVTGNNYKDRITKTFKTTSSLKARMFNDKLRLNADYTFRSKDYTETQKSTAVPYSAYEGVISYLGTPETDEWIKESLQLTSYSAVNAFAEYEDTFGEKHYFKALLGYNYEQQVYKSTYATRYGLLTPDVEHINFALGEQMTITSGGSKWRYAGAFFRLNYAYDERYLLEVNGRYDGTSKFPNNSQWGFFPSASVGYRISKEPWWHVNPMAVSNLKVRASFGELGNGNVDAYSYLEKFSFSTMGTGNGDTARYLDGTALLRYTNAPSQIPDNIGWERSRTFDVGLDAGFLDGRISLTADYYVRKTMDMYTVGPTLPDTFGASSPKGNYADMSTYGFELSLSYNDSFNLGSKPFNFGIKATLADYHSVIDRYNNDTKKLSDYYVGQTIGEIWGFTSYGLFQSQEEIDAAFGGEGYKNSLMQTSVNYITFPGDIKFEDLNDNHAIDKGSQTVDDPGDLRIIGNSEPRYLYSFSLNLDWNGIYASAFFQGVGKQDWYPSNESQFWGQYNRPYNQALKWMVGNYWTEDNKDAYLPRYTGYYAPFYKGTNNPNTRYLQNVAYIRLQNLQIGYNLPKRWTDKIKLSNVNIYFSGENLWTWSPLYRYTKDWDVVTVTKGSDSDINDGRGDGFNYPTMRSFSFGISITY